MNALAKQFPSHDFALLGIVLLMPLLGAFVNGVFGKRLGKPAVRLMALTAIGVSFVASVLTFLSLPPAAHEAHAKAPVLEWTAWRWMDLFAFDRTLHLNVGFAADAMTATMMLVVTGVGFLIHLYSSEYMKDDPGFYRFFAYLNLFIFSMLVLIMGDSLPILFVGWEGVGLCSYLLIGFWFTEEKNAAAGKKAFIANRIGDFGLLCAMAMLVYYSGALTFADIKTNAGGLMQDVRIWPLGNLPTEAKWVEMYPNGGFWPNWLVNIFLPEKVITVKAATLVGFAAFLGCAGKSAQVPLYVWLPDAMAGPTPVSALIHAATMVTAGVYLVARMCDVFVMSPAAMALVAVTGAITAVFAATMGFFQRDLKKVLAYSTVSQLGFMFIGVGVGAFTAGFFHVFTHAFFKACLFLCAGSVIHAMHARVHDTDKSQDMFNMGGLRKFMPITHAAYLVSCFSIAGFPFVTAGFYSKDEILWKAYSQQVVTNPAKVPPAGLKALDVGNFDVPLLKEPGYLWQWPTWLGPTLYWVGIIGATMTAFYMFRSYFLTFWGDFRGWKIVPGWVDPNPHHGHHEEEEEHAHDAHDDHAHAHKAAHDEEHAHGADDHDDHHHEEEVGVDKIQGPVPHESPLPMTIPLIVLGSFAVLAGFLGAEPLHIAPLIHKLEPIFAKASESIVARDGIDPHGALMWTMMVPGTIAMVVGAGLAYFIYSVKNGEPEEAFKKGVPGLYRLMYDKWRIDELYDATVIGMVDALADIFTMADKWIVDGVIARVTAAVTQGAGAVLRVFHTGRVQIYAASMVVGLVGMGWFFYQPHAGYVVDDDQLRATGKVSVTAEPGLGYTYKWSGDVPASEGNAVELTVEQGQTKNVVLTVRNVFGRESQETITLSRPKPKPAGPGQMNVPIQLQPRPPAKQGSLNPPSPVIGADDTRPAKTGALTGGQ